MQKHEKFLAVLRQFIVAAASVAEHGDYDTKHFARDMTALKSALKALESA